MNFQIFIQDDHRELAESSFKAGVDYFKQNGSDVEDKLTWFGRTWRGVFTFKDTEDFIQLEASSSGFPSFDVQFVTRKGSENYIALAVNVVVQYDGVSLDTQNIVIAVYEGDYLSDNNTMSAAIKAMVLSAIEKIEKSAQDPQAFSAIGRIRKTIHLL